MKLPVLERQQAKDAEGGRQVVREARFRMLMRHACWDARLSFCLSACMWHVRHQALGRNATSKPASQQAAALHPPRPAPPPSSLQQA